MKTSFQFVAVMLMAIFLFAWDINNLGQIDSVTWLIGTWENNTAKGSVYESWTRVNNIELAGKSFKVHEEDTVVFETIKLIEENNVLYYLPVVKNQNDGRPVRFTSKKVTKNELVFENLAHDFPQRIVYTLVAVISGTINGSNRSMVFPMKRVK